MSKLKIVDRLPSTKNVDGTNDNVYGSSVFFPDHDGQPGMWSLARDPGHEVSETNFFTGYDMNGEEEVLPTERAVSRRIALLKMIIKNTRKTKNNSAEEKSRKDTIRKKAENEYESIAKNGHMILKGPEIDKTYKELYTDEEEKRISDEAKRKEAIALADVKKAGFIRFPVWAKDLRGNDVEMEAWVHPDFEPSCTEGFRDRHGMDFNIYIPSYERYSSEKSTANLMNDFGVDNYYMVVDPSQFVKYKDFFDERKLIIRDMRFRDYDMYYTASSKKVPITMRTHAGIYNFILALSKSLGESHFWFADDDCFGFAMKAYMGEPKDREKLERLNTLGRRNEWKKEDFVQKTFGGSTPYNKDDFFRCSDLKKDYGFDMKFFLSLIEDLMSKIRNPGFMGLEKFGLVFSMPVKWKSGTRVYTFYLNDNKTALPQIGQQNNDVISSINLTKHGLANMLFEGIGYNSIPTQKVGSGGQESMYGKLGTFDKGITLVNAMPDQSKLAKVYNRVHHKVNYLPTANKIPVVGSPITHK